MIEVGLFAAVRRLRLSTLEDGPGPVKSCVCNGIRGRYNLPYDPNQTPDMLGWTTIALPLQRRQLDPHDDVLAGSVIDGVRVELRNVPHPVVVWLDDHAEVPVTLDAWTRTAVDDSFDKLATMTTVPRFTVRGIERVITRDRGVLGSVDGAAELNGEPGRYYTVQVATDPMPPITVRA